MARRRSPTAPRAIRPLEPTAPRRLRSPRPTRRRPARPRGGRRLDCDLGGRRRAALRRRAPVRPRRPARAPRRRVPVPRRRAPVRLRRPARVPRRRARVPRRPVRAGPRRPARAPRRPGAGASATGAGAASATGAGASAAGAGASAGGRRRLGRDLVDRHCGRGGRLGGRRLGAARAPEDRGLLRRRRAAGPALALGQRRAGRLGGAAGGRAAALQVRARILGHAVLADLEVHVRPGAAAGAADLADLLARLHVLVHGHARARTGGRNTWSSRPRGGCRPSRRSRSPCRTR